MIERVGAAGLFGLVAFLLGSVYGMRIEREAQGYEPPRINCDQAMADLRERITDHR